LMLLLHISFPGRNCTDNILWASTQPC